MSFWDKFESKQEGIEDTIEFTIRTAVVTLATVILVVVLALVVGLFMPNDVVDSTAILDMVNPAFQTIIGAFVGLLGGLSLNANARDTKPEEPTPVEPEPEPAPAPTPAPMAAPMAAPAAEVVQEELELDEPVDLDGDGVLQPWEIHAKDMRYDLNGDGVVDENDFPDWRSAGK